MRLREHRADAPHGAGWRSVFVEDWSEPGGTPTSWSAIAVGRHARVVELERARFHEAPCSPSASASSQGGALQDLAASAAGSLAGSLREI